MSKFDVTRDEYDVDFDDLGAFAFVRWKEMTASSLDSLTPADRATASKPRDDTTITAYIDERLKGPTSESQADRFLLQLKPVPRAIKTFSASFALALKQYDVDLSVLWGLLYLNIQLPLDTQSPDLLSRTADWTAKLRRALERFNRVYRDGVGDKHEAILALIDMLEHTLAIMLESARYLRYGSARRGEDDAIPWKNVQDKIKTHQAELDETIKHLLDMNTYSIASQATNIRNLELRHAIQPDDYERARFPIVELPFPKNNKFYGRSKELSEMDKYLKWDEKRALRTYSIYGRRGIGKTEIALQYAHQNPSKFDGIWWIACETSLTLRTSFTEMAISLNLPGADTRRNHEENLLNVQKWLKNTQKKWLMIFDNADRNAEVILRSYWPIGVNGSILITSRDYYNFMKDVRRKGQTVKVFDEQESWELLLQLMSATSLGREWTDKLRDGRLKAGDTDAARAWIQELGGLALSIQTAARLISNPKPATGENVTDTYLIFRKRREELPVRPLGDRSEAVHTLDSLFDITFQALSVNARNLLSVLSLLSPDDIPIELFLPRKQSALNGKLEFAKQESPIFINEKDSGAAQSGVVNLSSIVNLAPLLSKALEELRINDLIRWDHRSIAVHRVVQEAMNYSSQTDLQDSFDSAIHLVFEAFPKQEQDNSLYNDWKVCESYITHAVHLAKKVLEYSKLSRTLEPGDEFVELLCNATWYLYEMSDYDLGNEMIEIAKAACHDKESHVYSRLCNTHGSNYSELNKTNDTRKNFMWALGIRETLKVESYQGDRAIAYLNMGNVETASQHYDEALEYYQRAVEIYPTLGDVAAWKLGLVYMGIGRCYAAQARYQEARKFYSQAEQLFVRTKGSDKHFMAHCHYAYGNLEFQQSLFESATRSFEACLKIASSELPIHPLTAAAYYSLGCTENAMGNVDRAKGYLNKARNIAELRSPNRDDGTIARILWKMAVVMKTNPAGATPQEFKEADDMLNRASAARSALVMSGEGIEVKEVEDPEADILDARTRLELEEDSYDLLVPVFFR